MNKAEIETIKYVIKEYCPPNDLLVKAALKSLDDYAAPVAQQPQAEFLCESNDSPWLICKACAAEGKCKQQAEAVPSDVVRDAERYRKLRTFHWFESSMCVVLDPKKSVLLGAICPSGTNLDDYVDAAIAQQKDKK